MLDRRSRVTVVGATKRVDVAVPADAPVGEYVTSLVQLCGQARGGVMPPAWTLAPAGAEPIPVGMSLNDVGVTDGQVLYLRDVARDPGAAPVVEDIGEIAADEAERQRERGNPRGPMLVTLGLLWLVLSAGVAAVRHDRGPVSIAILLVLAGIGAVSTGWALRETRSSVPRVLSTAVILSATPCFSVAGGLLANSLFGTGSFMLGAVIGASLATLIALAAVPDPIIVAVEVSLVAAGALVAVLYASRLALSPVMIAASTTLTALVLIGLAKPVGAAIAAWSTRLPRGGPALAPAAVALIRLGRQTVAVLLAGPAMSLAVALPTLATSHQRQPLALLLAGAAGLGLLLRLRRAALTAEVVLLGLAGGVGVFAVVATVVTRYLSGGVAVFMLLAGALGMVGAGLGVMVMRHPQVVNHDAEPNLGGPAESPDRFKWVDVIATLCMVASALLAMAVFGVYGELATMGRGIIG